MNFWHFLLAIFVGRLIRFLILGILVLRFGPQVVAFGSELFAKHWVVLIVVFTAAAALGIYAWARSRKRSALQAGPQKN